MFLPQSSLRRRKEPQSYYSASFFAKLCPYLCGSLRLNIVPFSVNLLTLPDCYQKNPFLNDESLFKESEILRRSHQQPAFCKNQDNRVVMVKPDIHKDFL